MPLEVSLLVENKVVRMQEEVQGTVRLSNSGTSPVEFFEPNSLADHPVFHLRRISTGETRTIRRRPLAPEAPTQPTSLQPGEELNWYFWLNQLIEFPGPGEYEIVAEYAWGEGPMIARSEPLRLTVEGIVPQTMVLNMTQEPVAEEFYIFWTERSGDESHLVRTTVANDDLPQVVASDPAGASPPAREFSASNSAHGGNPLDTWLVWIAEGRLFFRLIAAESPKGQDFSIEMPKEASIRILPNPLMLDSGHGEVVLWLGGKGGDSAKLQLALISPSGQGEAGTDLALPEAAEPVWAQTAFLSNQERRLYLVYHRQGKLRLMASRWKKGQALGPLESLAEVEGELIAAGLSVLPGDEVGGRIAVRPANRVDTIDLLAWRHDAEGSVQLGEVEPIAVSGIGALDDALVRINEDNEAFLALRPAGGPWQVREPEGAFSTLGGEVGSTSGPLALFFNSAQEPVFVYVRPGSGFFFADFTGEPVQTTQRG